MLLSLLLLVQAQSAPDYYPPEALRRGEQGDVKAELAIDDRGRVTGCRIVESSGSAILDRQTCKMARDRITMRPALDTAGKPIASTKTMRMSWRLPDDAVQVVVPKQQP